MLIDVTAKAEDVGMTLKFRTQRVVDQWLLWRNGSNKKRNISNFPWPLSCSWRARERQTQRQRQRQRDRESTRERESTRKHCPRVPARLQQPERCNPVPDPLATAKNQ